MQTRNRNEKETDRQTDILTKNSQMTNNNKQTKMTTM